MRDKYEYGKDYTSSSDMLDDVNNLSEWVKKDPITNAIYDFVESNVGADEDKVISQLNRLYAHMLKFEFQPNRQTKSWISTIKDSSNQISNILRRKTVKNRITYDILESCYNSGVDWASKETGIPVKNFPKHIPDDWTLDNITDKEFIKNFIYLRLQTEEAHRYYYTAFREEG